MNVIIVILGIISTILGIAVALFLGISIANSFIYDQLTNDNSIGDGKTFTPSKEDASKFVIISEPCEMTMDLNWYSKEIKNPVIKKNGEGISSVSGCKSCVGDRVGAVSDADVDELFADFDK